MAEKIPRKTAKKLAARDGDRVGRLLDRATRRRRVLVSPEGVPLDIQLAGHGERLTAMILDLIFMTAGVLVLFLVFLFLLFQGAGGEVVWTLFLFLAFLVHNFYFLHFELAWQGRTPGKKICRLRVINRHGGELTPGAVIARNLTREVEIFMPMGLLLSLTFSSGWVNLMLFGWVMIIAALPLFNKGGLRAGDLIAGTQVIAMPDRALLSDLTAAPAADPEAAGFIFTPEQLAIYGVFELQVLEEFLRRPPSPAADQALAEICQKIQRKIDWTEPVPESQTRRFLTEFYAAERAELERGQLFGKTRADKSDAPAKFTFTPEQLSAYGDFERGVLEDILNKPQSPTADQTLNNICAKIRLKIAWPSPVPPHETRRFLTDFLRAGPTRR